VKLRQLPPILPGPQSEPLVPGFGKLVTHSANRPPPSETPVTHS
jgi:hypothetical protein